MKKEDLFFTGFIDGLLMLLSTAVPFALTIKNYYENAPSIDSRLALLISCGVLFLFYFIQLIRKNFIVQLAEGVVAIIALLISFIFVIITLSRETYTWLDSWSMNCYVVGASPIILEIIFAVAIIDIPKKRDERKKQKEAEKRRKKYKNDEESPPEVDDI